jgi:hypothetical protein
MYINSFNIIIIKNNFFNLYIYIYIFLIYKVYKKIIKSKKNIIYQ